jgi:type II secretory pathway component PulF
LLVLMAAIHVLAFGAFGAFMTVLVPEFAGEARSRGTNVSGLADALTALSDAAGEFALLAVSIALLLTALDLAALFWIAKKAGKRGALIWSVLLAAFFTALMFAGLLGYVDSLTQFT